MDFVIKDMNRIKRREDKGCPMSIAYVVRDCCDELDLPAPFTVDTFNLHKNFEITPSNPTNLEDDKYLMIRMGWKKYHIVVIWDGCIIYPYLMYLDNTPIEDDDVKSHNSINIPFSGEDFHRNLIYLDNV